MKLYDTARAPNPRRVLIYLAEKGLLGKIDELEIEQVSIMEGEHKTPEYRKVSPLSQVPCLVLDDGTGITESVAICRYFEELYPNPPLFGTDAKSRTLIEMWIRRLDLSFLIPVAMHFRHTHPMMATLENQIKEWGELNKARVEKVMGFLNKSLEGKDFIAGDYSIADVLALTTLDFATGTRIPIPAELKNLSAYHKRLLDRPSAQASA
jgi:glutathione S-transferase